MERTGPLTMQNKKFDWLTRLEEIPSRIYVFMAIAMLAIDTAICAFTNADPAIVGIITISVYTVASLVVYFLVQRRLNLYRLESNASEAQTKGVIYSFKNQLRIPYAVVSEQGKIITVNSAFSTATGTKGTIFNKDINEYVVNFVAENFQIGANKPLEFSVKATR